MHTPHIKPEEHAQRGEEAANGPQNGSSRRLLKNLPLTHCSCGRYASHSGVSAPSDAGWGPRKLLMLVEQ